MSYIDVVVFLTEHLPPIKNSRKLFRRHITRFINKIHEAIENLENNKKFLCFPEELEY